MPVIMTPLKTNTDLSAVQSRLIERKRRYGVAYGAVVGLAFVFFTWGWDGYILSQSHGFLPWLKLILAGAACALAGSAAGWATARLEHWFITAACWLAVAVFFTWITVALPLQIVPRVSAWVEPQLMPMIEIVSLDQLNLRLAAASLWIVPFFILAGGLQSVLVESSVFAASRGGSLAPFLIGVLIAAICGVIVDGFINEPLRSAMTAMDGSVQFVLDNRGAETDPALSRKYHAGALRGISDEVTPRHAATVVRYSSDLIEIRIALKFEDLLADCLVVYNQPIFCEAVSVTE